jgi:CheY-like chemotaxis protein
MSELKELKAKINHLSVLVVDDEPAVLEGTSDFMRKFFHEVKTATNAHEALKVFEADSSIDVIFSDVKMPGMNGWELIQQLHAKNPNLFLGIMTGSPDEHPERMEICDVYLKKPVSIDEMVDLMNKLISVKGL